MLASPSRLGAGLGASCAAVPPRLGAQCVLHASAYGAGGSVVRLRGERPSTSGLALDLVAEDGSKSLERGAREPERPNRAKLGFGSAAQTKGRGQRGSMIAILGHVDHGKTTLLDAIRRTRVAQREAGGITQTLGVHTVEVEGAYAEAGVECGPAASFPLGRKELKRLKKASKKAHAGQAGESLPTVGSAVATMTFIDTPGHAAFARMRSRGALATDVAALVVAADAGVQAQTVEALDLLRASGVPYFVAVTKTDLPGASAAAVRAQLAAHGVELEGWGGQTPVVELAARSTPPVGLDRFLETALLLAELEELRASEAAPARGVVLEGGVDAREGPFATLLLRQGRLRPGADLVAGAAHGRARAVRRGSLAVAAGTPGTAVTVTGWHSAPAAGEDFEACASAAEARERARAEAARRREHEWSRPRGQADPSQADSSSSPRLPVRVPVVVKAAATGSLEALLQTLAALPQARARVEVVSAGCGALTLSDVDLAAASNALLLSFGVPPPPPAAARRAADHRLCCAAADVIYDAADQVRAAMRMRLPRRARRARAGRAEVLALFGRAGARAAGCRVAEGALRRSAELEVRRGGVLVAGAGEGYSLRRGREDVRAAGEGEECGVSVRGFSDWQVGDQIEAWETVWSEPVLEDEEVGGDEDAEYKRPDEEKLVRSKQPAAEKLVRSKHRVGELPARHNQFANELPARPKRPATGRRTGGGRKT